MTLFRRLDRAWARGEAALTVGVLLAMVLIASFSAGIRNLTRFDLVWANALLADMDWADSFLRKATALLAFLGASQATYHRKHISIDVFTRSLPLKPRFVVHAINGAAAGLIVLAMALSLASAVRLNLSERPVEYEVLGDASSIHVCDATPQRLAQLPSVEVPSVFCRARALLLGVGIRAETPGAAFQLIVPLLFVVMACRCFGIAAVSARAVFHGDAAMRQLESEELARIAAVHASLRDSGETKP